jgi:hypothetical protein
MSGSRAGLPGPGIRQALLQDRRGPLIDRCRCAPRRKNSPKGHALMAWIPGKVVARIRTASDGLAELSWNGCAGHRAGAAPAHRDGATRNGTHGRMRPNCPPATCRPSVRATTGKPGALESLAHHHGHQATCRPGREASRARDSYTPGYDAQRDLTRSALSVRPARMPASKALGFRAGRALSGDGMTAQPGDAPALGEFRPPGRGCAASHPRRDMSRSGPWLRVLQTTVTRP